MIDVDELMDELEAADVGATIDALPGRPLHPEEAGLPEAPAEVDRS